MRRSLIRTCLLLLGIILLGACSTTTSRNKLAALQTQEKVELDRYFGRWYVIANIPYLAEKGKVGAYVEYHPRADGKIDDWYFFRKQNFDQKLQQWSGLAWVIEPRSNARWKAQFVWPFKFDYLILATAPDYSWALVGHPSRDLAWVFARTPEIDERLYQDLLKRLAAMDYDPQRIKRVPQIAGQIGLPGFQ
jgi:apolipoprotein D and lipocalin family protein